uniref:Uncharacterized protein n=1 Tax=Panagrolaimus davidi TaxID=227884 RepID=A0A914PXE7_9BILA
MSDNFDSAFLDEFGSYDGDELLRGLFDDVEKEDDGYDLYPNFVTPTTTSETPLKTETVEEKVKILDGNESVVSASSGYQSLNSIESSEQYLENSQSVDGAAALSPKPSVLAEMLSRDSSSPDVHNYQQPGTSLSPQNAQQQHHELGYPMNNYYYPQYHQVTIPSQMMQQQNQQYYQPQYVYYPNQMQYYHQNLHYQPNAQVQRLPYQPVYAAQPAQQPSAQVQHRQMPVRPSYVHVYPNQQQQYSSTQALPQIRQIPPKSMLDGFQTSNPETFTSFEMPPTSTKMVMSAIDKNESRATRTIEPYKLPIVIPPKPRDRQVTGEAALLELNRVQYQRWRQCVEYMKTYLSSHHELIPFINKEEIAKAYAEVIGKEIKYSGIVTRLTKLCNIRFDGCPVFQKTKQRNTYEIFPTLIPSPDGTSCPIQIVNGLPVETDYI